MEDVVLSVSDFVAVLNQTLEYAYPSVIVQGELANFRVSKNRWVYFDLKDENASVKFFGTVYHLPGPLEDGLMMQVRGMPRLHQLYGFSINVQSMQPVGEGSLQKAAALLEAKLATEGLFDAERKRLLPYPPQRIGLITSSESAAYHDFMKILNARWIGLEVELADVQVQGEQAPGHIIRALEHFNSEGEPVDVIIITRGGGSAEDLAAFSTEQVTRAVAGSRIPTLVAIGHEVDFSLAELAADQRASTPSNAAELLVPDKQEVIRSLQQTRSQMYKAVTSFITTQKAYFQGGTLEIEKLWQNKFGETKKHLADQKKLLKALSPQAALKRGYAIARTNNQIVRSAVQVKKGDRLSVSLYDGRLDTIVDSSTRKD